MITRPIIKEATKEETKVATNPKARNKNKRIRIKKKKGGNKGDNKPQNENQKQQQQQGKKQANESQENHQKKSGDESKEKQSSQTNSAAGIDYKEANFYPTVSDSKVIKEVKLGSSTPLPSLVLRLLKCDFPQSSGEQTQLIFSDDSTIDGDISVSRYLARTNKDKQLYGEDVLASSEVDSWLQDFDHNNHLENLQGLNLHLTLRTYFAGKRLSLADLAIYSILKSHADKLTEQPHLNRWFLFVDSFFTD
jgi:hypothetical protein